ncbi:MAG: RICIN domain-containing protein [Butyrivibrio sp.]|nr:RICIN domain-containing protein [Butyrivibrio sp.]
MVIDMNGKRKRHNVFSMIISLLMALALSVSGVSAETLAAPAVESESPQTEAETETGEETAPETASATEEDEEAEQTETEAETVTEEETETVEVVLSMESGFAPRESAPNKNDPNDYEHYWNNSYPEGPNYPINNCTKYAYGRAYELLGYRPNNSGWGDAGSWYYGKDGYDRNPNVNEPRLGAIICWNGHVAVVEKIEGEMVTFSDSSWPYSTSQGTNPGWTFQLHTKKKSEIVGYVGGFQGYIYLPGIPNTDPPKPAKPAINPTNKFGNDFHAYIRYAVNATYIESAECDYGDDSVKANAQTSGVTLAYDYGPEKIWHFQYARNDRFGASYTISNDYGTLDVYGAGDNGGDVVVYKPIDGGANQRWYLDDIGGSNFRLVPVYSYDDDYKPALFLDAGTASVTDKAVTVRNLSAHTEAGEEWNFAQQFSIDIIENYAEPITDYGDDFYAYIAYGYSYIETSSEDEMTDDGNPVNNVRISDPTEFALQPSYEPRQIWHFIKDKSGKGGYKDSYKIVNEYNGLCMDVVGGNNVHGTNIWTYPDNDGPAQRWYIIPDNDGVSCKLMPVYCYRTGDDAQGLVLDVTDGKTDGGTNVWLCARRDVDAQRITVNRLNDFYNETLKNYSIPSAPEAPESVNAAGNRYVTKIYWDEVQRTGAFDSRMYELLVYEGDSAGGQPVISLKTEKIYYMADNLPKGIYTAQVKSVNAKYKDLVSPSVAITFKVGEKVELGFTNAGDQILRDGKIELTVTYDETAPCNVKIIAAAYTTDGKMQDSVTLSQELESGDNKIAVSTASLVDSDHIKIFCLDRNTLAPLTDSLVYSKNPVAAEWSPAADMPAGVTVLDEKWTYTEITTETVTDTSPALDGWTRTGTSLQQTDAGTHYYADYPGGFQITHALYNAYNKNAMTADETETTKRTVSDAAVKGYIYYHWTHNNSQLPNENYNVLVENAYCWNNGKEYYNFRAFESHGDYGHTDPNGINGGDCYYAWNNDPADGSWWWYCFPVYQQTYTDYRKIFTYEKKTATERESKTQVMESDTINNVQHWVKYSVNG